MKKKSASRSAFFNPRFLISFAFCAIGVLLTLLAFALYPGATALARQNQADVPAALQENVLTLQGRLMHEPSLPPLSVKDLSNVPDNGHIDMAAHPAPGPLPLRQSSGGPAPDGAAVGTSNAFLGITTEVVNQSITNAFGTLASGFTPAESVQFWLNGALAGTFAASANGTVAVGINTGAGFGFITFDEIGLTSGKQAGGITQVAPTGPYLQGVAAAPHSVNTSTAAGPLLLYGWGYPAATSVNLYRNGVSIGTATTSAAGRYFVSVTPANNGNTAAVYSSDLTGVAGSMASTTVEERSDAGPPPFGDQNVSRAFLDRTGLNAATGGTLSIVGEGFQVGETVTISGCAAGSAAADANGSFGAFLTFAPAAGASTCTLTGGTSGRVARAAVLEHANVTNMRGLIVRPQFVSPGGTVIVMATKLPASDTGQIFLDGVLQGTATTNASGSGTFTLTKPAAPAPGSTPPASDIVHEVGWIATGGTGDAQAAALLLAPAGVASPTPTASPSPTAPPSPTPATPTPTPTPPPATPSATPTPGACGLVNSGFETGTFPPWVILNTAPLPFVSNAQAHSGTQSAFVGSPVGGETPGDSSFYQTLTVPAGGGTLTYWYLPTTIDSITFDWQDAYVTDTSGAILATIMHVCSNAQAWTQVNFDMTPFAGQTIRIEFLVHGDNAGDWTNMYVDDVCLPGGTTATPTPGTPTPTPSCPPSVWTAVASFPAPDIYGGTATSNGTSAWLAGGYSFSASSDVSAFRRYDLGSNTWTTLAPMPDIISNASAVYSPINNKVYVFGGGNATTGVVSNATRIYDVAAGTWSAGTNMPDVRGFMAKGYFNGKIYLVGGYSTGNISPAFAQVWEYDPIANTFNTTRLDMPATLGGAGSAVINGHLYVAGGRDATNTVVASLFDYDIAANTWTTRAPMPSANNVPGAGVLSGQLWIYGGGNPFLDTPETTNASIIYDPGTNAWTAGPSLTEARSFVAGTNIGNTLFAAGGYNGATTVTTTETLSGGACASPTPGITPTPSVAPSCPPTITESSTQTITALNSVSCNNGTGHTDNSYWRAFNMNSFVGGFAYTVTSVSFGIEQATGAGGTQPITVRLYTSNQNFPTGWPASLTQIGIANMNVPDSASNTIFTVPIAATVPANAQLVMEVFTPDGTVAGNLLFMGSNADPESAPSYLSAAGCGITTPTTTAAIGFPNMHLVFNVNGSCGGPSPSPGITPTPSPTATASASSTPCAGGGDVIVDGGFENGGIPDTNWPVETSTNFGTPLCDFASCGNGGGASPPRTGLIWVWFGGIAAPETATIGQTVTIPSGGPATLHFWMRIGTVTAPFDDVLNVRVDGAIVQSYIEPAVAETDYTERVINLNAFANGASHALLFEYIGTSSGTGSYVVDDVSLIAGSACPSATPSIAPSPSPSCAPAWAAGPNFPAAAVLRAPGNYFPANGRFYSIGGRSSDLAGSDFTNPFEYNPATNAWTTKPSTLPDGQVNNMACGVLTVSGTDQIYCVGGSQATIVGNASRVFSYNPATDTFTTLAAGDNWPGSQAGAFLPGGFAVAGNKLYIIGSFNANSTPPVVTNQVWQFDPTAAVGSKWLARANYPVARGYVPAAAIGGLIYTAGGSNIDPGGLLIDTNDSFTYNPATDGWSPITSIPRATGETRAVVMNGKMWVLGGGRVAPNPGSEVDIYDPVANTWSVGLPFDALGRRNFPADSDGTSHIFMAGGYDNAATQVNTMRIFGSGPCVSPSPTPSPSITPIIPTPTPTPATPTPTPATPTPTITPPTDTPTPTPPTTPSPTPGISPPAQAVNFSTRMHVEGGDRVGIGGFIVSGVVPKRLIVRAIGPSLTRYGLIDVLADPVLELHGPTGFVTITNDNWRDTQEAEIQATGLPPTNNLESAIVATLAPGNYTAIVRAGPSPLARTGLALVEVYDLAQDLGKLGNISTRAFCGTDDNVIIAGFILGNHGGNDQVIVRGMGPSLTAQGVPDVLANPTLQLRNANGALISSNNDWQDNPDQAAIISAACLAPGDPRESAIAATLPPGLYTALLAGLNPGSPGSTGNALVEVYDRGDGSGGCGPSPTPGITPVPSATPSPGVPTPTPSAPPATPTPTPPPASPTPSPTTCTENFDGVTPPALPPGWTQTIVAGPPPGWVTSTGDPDPGEVNNAFIIDTAVVSDKVLDRAGVVINSSAPVLSFRNNFNTEFSDGTYWDGGVLEVASPNINGGAFTDVTNALVGGSFVTGEYTGTIDTTAGSPLAGRDAWSGNSGGYIDSVINLGPNLNGQTVTLRWRMGTDEASAEVGWRVDSVVVTGASCP